MLTNSDGHINQDSDGKLDGDKNEQKEIAGVWVSVDVDYM